MSDDKRQAWLDSLKAGDEVAYKSGYGNGVWMIAKVTKRTKAGWIIASHLTFGKNGKTRGRGEYSTLPAECCKVTPEIREKVEHQQLVARMGGTEWKYYTSETLRKVIDVLMEAQ